MIESFRHKGLKRFFEKGDRRGLPPQMIERIEEILTALTQAQKPQDMNIPPFRLHPLKGERGGY